MLIVKKNNKKKTLKFVHAWLLKDEFKPWLEPSADGKYMKCKWCARHKTDTVWASVGCKSLRIESIRLHLRSAEHKAAADAQTAGKVTPHVTLKTSAMHKALVARFRNILWL